MLSTIRSTNHNFYPRPPRGGRLSCPATPSTEQRNFYPRPPRGGRLTTVTGLFRAYDFYPRPPRGGRLVNGGDFVRGQQFLSTPSARRATLCDLRRVLLRRISIHALREEGDVMPASVAPMTTRFLSTPSARRATRRNGPNVPSWSYFYPRPPRGGRPSTRKGNITRCLFLSTPSARRAT